MTKNKLKHTSQNLKELYEEFYVSDTPMRFGQYYINNTVNFKDQSLSQKIYYSKASPSDIKALIELYIFDDLI